MRHLGGISDAPPRHSFCLCKAVAVFLAGLVLPNFVMGLILLISTGTLYLYLSCV